MDDTKKETQDFYRKKFMDLSAEQRFLIGASMFESARKMILASLGSDEITDRIKKELFLRLYGNDLPKEKISKIIKHFNC